MKSNDSGDTPTGQKPENTISQHLRTLKDAITKKRPILGDILHRHGDQTIHDYSKDFIDVNPAPRLDSRKSELIEMAKKLITERLGSEVGEGVAKQLYKKSLVSTIDHHGPITHPFFLNCNIISALPMFALNDPDIRYAVVFSFASVSLNNASAYPRGILFHGDMNGAEHTTIRLPLLADKYKMGVVYGIHGFTGEDIDRAKKQLSEKVKQGELSKERADKIVKILDTHFGNEDILSTPDLSTQITKINYKMWPSFFHGKDSTYKSDLIYLDIETLVREILLKHHLSDKNSLLYRILFEPKMQTLAQKYFNNLPGAFSLENGWGTHFFWTMDDKLRRVGLQFKDNALWCDEAKHFEFTPEEVIKHLEEKKILPSMLMCYLTVSLYYGMKCLGGFCQVHDLTMIKKAWQDLLHEIEEHEEAEAIEPVQTKELGGDGLVLSYMRTYTDKLIPATGIDMILDPNETSMEKYVEISKKVSLMEMMNTMLPEMYTVLYAAPDREEKFSSISSAEILTETGVEEKLKKHF